MNAQKTGTKLDGDEALPIIDRVRLTSFNRHDLSEIVLSREDFMALKMSQGIMSWVQPDGSMRVFGLPISESR